MSRQNPLSVLRNTLSRYVDESFAALATILSSFTVTRPRLDAGPAESVVPAPVPAAPADLPPVELSPSPPEETDYSPTVANADPVAAIAADSAAVSSPVAAAPAPPIPDSQPAPDYPTLAADPELDALRTRVAAMETRVFDLETRKAELDQLLDEYAFRHYQALGELLGEQLRLQHELLRLVAERSSATADKQAAEAAAAEYEAYQRAGDQAAIPPATLDDGERKELTTLYRAAAMRCHPDRVGDAEKEQAHAMFLRTQDAYRRRDLEAMRMISRQLGTGNLQAPLREESTPRARLEAILEGLMDRGAELLLAIQSIQMQAQYRKARYREQWEDYFAEARASLEQECAALRRQIARA